VQLFEKLIAKAKSSYCGFAFGARGLYLGPGCKVKGTRFISFGNNFFAHGNLWLEALVFYKGQQFVPSVQIGNDVSISERVHISCIEHVRIGNGVLIGSGSFIADHNHGIYSGIEQSIPSIPPAQRVLGGGGPVRIEDNVWIGDNVVIVGPVSIGTGSIIGANSVVRKDIPAHTMAAGAPARAIKCFNAQMGRWERV
jgi:lipopolysaccharide O-acetyltransferase